VLTDNSAYASENGVLYNRNKTALIKYPEGKTGELFSIPNSVYSIREYAFLNCTSLGSVTIPNDASIGDYAFFNCTSLISVKFERSIYSGSFSNINPFPGDLRAKFYATDPNWGTPGKYIRSNGTTTWMKRP
jgi:hypothetical protein